MTNKDKKCFYPDHSLYIPYSYGAELPSLIGERTFKKYFDRLWFDPFEDKRVELIVSFDCSSCGHKKYIWGKTKDLNVP